MVDRDFKDIGEATFTVKSFVVRNGLPSAKSNTVLAAWNPPKEWGRFDYLTALKCMIYSSVLNTSMNRRMIGYIGIILHGYGAYKDG